MENLSWYKPVIYLGTVSMAFINLATSSLGMINPIETFTLAYNLYLEMPHDYKQYDYISLENVSFFYLQKGLKFVHHQNAHLWNFLTNFYYSHFLSLQFLTIIRYAKRLQTM